MGGRKNGGRRPGRIYHVIRALSDVTLLYVKRCASVNNGRTVVGERLNARAKDKHAKQSAPEEDQEREVCGSI